MLKEYIKRPVSIKAEQITRECYIESPYGMLKGEVGDWLIEESDGKWYPCSDDVFKKTFVPAGHEEEGFENPFLFIIINLNATHGELGLPPLNKEEVESVLGFIIKGFAKSMIVSDNSFADIHQSIHTAVNYGLTEAYQEAYNEEKEQKELGSKQ